MLNFLSTMEQISYGVLRVKLSFYNGNNLLWSFTCKTFFLQWKQSSKGFPVLNFLSTMDRIFYGVLRVKLSFYNGKNLLLSFTC